MFLEAEELFELTESPPEKFVQCLPNEGAVDVASVELAEVLRHTELAQLFERFPAARDAFPFEWLKALLLAPSTSQRHLCAWFGT
jgi:hypothetical protein